jgi:hypothetical protein
VSSRMDTGTIVSDEEERRGSDETQKARRAAPSLHTFNYWKSIAAFK